MIIRGFPEKVPRLCKKTPTFFGKSPTFLSKLPTFFQKTPFFFSKYYPSTSTKKSKFGEKYSQDRRTSFLLPLYFLVPLCFTRQSVKVVKAKSAKLLYVRARVIACAFFMNAPLSPLSLAVLLEKQSVVLQFHFCNLERGTIVTSRQVVYSRVTYAYFFLCYICIKIIVQVLL